MSTQRDLGPINERTSARYAATLTDQAGVAIVGSQLEALTLTLYDRATGTILNSRDSQDVLQTNGVTVSDGGALVWLVSPADNVIVGGGASERHVALFHATWYGGARELWHEVPLSVTNLTRVP